MIYMDSFNVKTIEKDEAYLRQVSKDVLKGDPKLKEEIKKISNYCKNNEVFAMASVQLGIPKKIIYIKSTDEKASYGFDIVDDEAIIMINPIIIEEKGETYFWENCVSCIDNTGKVKRPYSIKIKYFDEKFNEKEEILEGFKATVFSHEYDHLYGILHMDIAEEIKVMPVEERKLFRQKPENKYNIVSKTKEYKHPLR